jgi:hypothetical protein
VPFGKRFLEHERPISKDRCRDLAAFIVDDSHAPDGAQIPVPPSEPVSSMKMQVLLT